jgi:RNA polymerase II-associated factor 1
MQRSTIRPQRTRNIARTNYGVAEDDEPQVVDQLDLTVDDPTEEMKAAMKMYARHPMGWDQDEEEELHRVEQSIEEADVDADGDAEGEEADRNGASSPVERYQDRSPSADRDAEGDEDEDED